MIILLFSSQPLDWRHTLREGNTNNRQGAKGRERGDVRKRNEESQMLYTTPHLYNV